MMRLSISQLGFLILFLTILLNEVNGQMAAQGQMGVIFDLKKALCYRLVDTWGCFLDALPRELGGKQKTCISKMSEKMKLTFSF
uniref:Uncharacterized protein n=1 Tax=Trichobilharzia regenti TaxID=157069 RepID=A0AA85J4T0_TRIRE|nr:unnamed protein product [Trichobilharzia regenti]